jgi:hypothetical protein
MIGLDSVNGMGKVSLPGDTINGSGDIPVSSPNVKFKNIKSFQDWLESQKDEKVKKSYNT